MFASLGIRKTVFAVMVSLATCTGCRAAAKVPAPPPANDTTLAQAPGQQTAVFAGGCFWGTQSVFERVKGVVATTAGYAGGSAATATYGQVIRGVSFTPATTPPVATPEVPGVLLLPLAALAIGGGALWVERRRRRHGALTA